MKAHNFVPEINFDSIFIVHRDQTELAAVTSSYFGKSGEYTPFFIFPKVNISDTGEDEFADDGYIQRAFGSEIAILINNAMARLPFMGRIVLVGLNEHQKSYLRLPKKMEIIEISNLTEAHEKLKPLSTKKNDLHCKGADIVYGLYEAKMGNSFLVIDEKAPPINPPKIDESKGIVVLEDSEDAMRIVAVNYAVSINSNLKVVEGFPREERYSIQKNLLKWQKDGSHNKLQRVLNRISQRISDISFSNLKFATFFTVGLPYSLWLKNSLPCSYVNLALRPDLFIMNSIIFENIERFNSALVFSPGFFKDEETYEVYELLKKKEYYVRPLVDKAATVHNLDYNAQHFPYDILHICSHGGEVDGYAVTETYTDREGIKHTVEYDEVVNFSPTGKDLIAVFRKTFFRKFDGHIWMSEDLKAQKYPSYVFEDMRKSLYGQDAKTMSKAKREKKEGIATSCAIQCVDDFHQGAFRTLASHSSPFIFNNTCQSWLEVSTFFIAGGAVGYVGTLWNIGNDAAVIGSNTFYKNLFGNTLLEAFSCAVKSIEATTSTNIYIFWGLHFSTLSIDTKYDANRSKVFRELVRSLFSWRDKVKTTKSEEIKKNSIEVLRQIHSDLITNFKVEDYEKLDAEVNEYIMKKTEANVPSKIETRSSPPTLDNVRYMEQPVEYRKA